MVSLKKLHVLDRSDVILPLEVARYVNLGSNAHSGR